jgi:nucleotide-binding universal stress UspA family protein
MTLPTVETTSFKTIVVGTDFQASSQRAVALAANLAQASGGELVVVHTFELPTYGYSGMEMSAVDWVTPMQDAAKQSLNALVAELTQRGSKARGVLGVGAAWEQILHVAKDVKADLVVVGTHGRVGMLHALLGSVAEKVVRMCPLPVLTVRGPG